MYLSQLFIPITKDLPAEAKVKSHQLMLQTGMIRQSSAGIYSWLPLGFKVMKKIDFYDQENPKQVKTRVRRLIKRLQPDKLETGILRGFLSKIEQILNKKN